MDKLFGIKELYDITLKATSNMEINGENFEFGEVIFYLEKAAFSTIAQIVKDTKASGGKGDLELINWRETEDVSFSLSLAKVNAMTLALLSGAKQAAKNTNIPRNEYKNSNAEGLILLSELPIKDNFFVYAMDEKGAYNKTKDFILEGKNLLTKMPLKNFFTTYYYEATPKNVLQIGQDAFQGFFKLEAKAIYKDENSGLSNELLIQMPKVRFDSNIVLNLGSSLGPAIQNMKLVALQERVNNDKISCEVTFL